MIRILTDSACDILPAEAQQLGVTVIPLNVTLEDGSILRDGIDMTPTEYYAHLASCRKLPTTSQPSPELFERFYQDAAAAGDEVLGIFISSELSGTYEGAVRAARAVKARNIDFTYVIVDSTSCGYDEAWPVFDAVAARDAGEDLAGCAAAALRGIESTRFLFTPETLTFLQRGGRIGNAAALLGNLIQLSPVLTVSDGKADTFAKVRTRKKALDRIVTEFKKDVEQHGLKHVVVHYIGDKAPAVAWAREVVEPLIGRTVSVLPVSPVIGLHVGPAVGLAYECASALAGKISGPVQARACAS